MGPIIDNYQVQYRTSVCGNEATWSTFETTAALSPTVGSLTNGTLYEFRVLAHNTAGLGDPSNILSTTPRTAPGTPTGLGATPGNTQVALTWAAPASNGGAAITDYQVQYKLSADPPANWALFDDGSSPATGATVTGLTNGLSYEFRVRAVNVAGGPSWFIPPPPPPRGRRRGRRRASARLRDTQVVLNWAAPDPTAGPPSPTTRWNTAPAVAAGRLSTTGLRPPRSRR